MRLANFGRSTIEANLLATLAVQAEWILYMSIWPSSWFYMHWYQFAWFPLSAWIGTCFWRYRELESGRKGQ